MYLLELIHILQVTACTKCLKSTSNIAENVTRASSLILFYTLLCLHYAGEITILTSIKFPQVCSLIKTRLHGQELI